MQRLGGTYLIPTLEGWRQERLTAWRTSPGRLESLRDHMCTSDAASGLYLGISQLQSVMEIEGVDEIVRGR